MLLAHKNISDLQHLANLYNTRLPNIEGDQVAHLLQMTSQWGHCKHNCIISLCEVLKCLERMKFNSCDIIQILIALSEFSLSFSKLDQFRSRRPSTGQKIIILNIDESDFGICTQHSHIYEGYT